MGICRRRVVAEAATTGKNSLGVSDLIDKDTRAQGRRMTLDSEEGATEYEMMRESEIPVSKTVWTKDC